MHDVLIAGAGPAGATAALLLARAGVRVRLIDRAPFPRDKLCGDTVNPGTLAILRRLGIARKIEERGLRIDGMILTGEGGARVVGRYPAGIVGCAIVRRDLDALLLEEAIRAGAEFEEKVTVRAPRFFAGSVEGAMVSHGGGRVVPLTARVTIAADGRRSTLAFAMRLARHPVRPRRWAIGAYYEGVAGLGSFGEMHVRGDHYLGVARVPGGLANTCLVTSIEPVGRKFGNPAALVAGAINRDPWLGERFAGARLACPPVVLGPLGVNAPVAGARGLLLAGDAAGFIDPMTGDGLRFAIRGGELAAEAALACLRSGQADVHLDLTRARAAAFSGKYRFNRAVRRFVDWPAGVRLAARGARLAPGLLQYAILVAGDVGRW